jgi:hypothetical protein
MQCSDQALFVKERCTLKDTLVTLVTETNASGEQELMAPVINRLLVVIT